MWNDADDDLRRLIDDELDPAAVDEMLAACDRDPARWRQVALALLEDREWRRGATSPAVPMPMLAGIDFPCSATATSVAAAAPVNISERLSAAASGRPQMAYAALAAGLALLVGALGFLAGRGGIGSAAVDRDAIAAIEPRTSGDRGETNDDGSAAGRIREMAADAGASEEVGGDRTLDERSQRSLPYYVGTPSYLPKVSARTQLDLLRRGVLIEEVPVVHEVERNGRRYAVPDSRIGVRYVGGLAYQ